MGHHGAERLRVTFGVTAPLCYVSVLDMGRVWSRLLRRAHIPLAYTRGFSPHPKLYFASALPVGYTSDCELVDIILNQPMVPSGFTKAAAVQCPSGLAIIQTRQVALSDPKPQSQMREATYRVGLRTSEGLAVQEAVDQLLSRESVTRSRTVKGRHREYNLRPLVHGIRYLATTDSHHVLEMSLRCGSHGSGRPEEVIASLGLELTSYTIHRTGLIWQTEEEHGT